MTEKEITKYKNIGNECIEKSFSNNHKKKSMKKYWDTVINELINKKRTSDLKIMTIVINNLILNKSFEEIYNSCSSKIIPLDPIKNTNNTIIKYSVPEIIKELSCINPRAALFADYWRLKTTYNKKIPNE